MQTVKKIDIHAHVVPFPEYAAPLQTGVRMLSAEELIQIYDKLNIERGVLLPLNSSEYHYDQITSCDCKYVVDKYPDRFLWFCGVDPRSAGHNEKSDLSIVINHFKNLGARGIGELTAQMYADDPMMDNLFYHAASCDMPVTIHIAPKLTDYYGIIDELGLPRLESMLKKHKNLKILGHSQLFWSEMSSDITEDMRGDYPKGKIKEGRIPKLMREYENLYCDLSATSGANAMMRDPEYTAKFMEEFSDRILYGCDICTPTNSFQYDFDAFLDKMVEDKMLSSENYYKIVRGNAEKLLKL